MPETYQISDKMLKKDMKRFKSLHSRTFSEEVHWALRDLDTHIGHVLRSFMKGRIQLTPDQYRLFAQYISVVGGAEKEILYAKLQETADFNVKEYVKKSNRTWWQKLFNVNTNMPYMSAKKMKKILDEYAQKQHDINHNGFNSQKKIKRVNEIQNYAFRYMKAYLEGEIEIRPEDMRTFKHYVKTMEYPIYDGSLGDQVLKKMEATATTTETVKAPVKTSKKSWWKSQKEKLKSLCQTCGAGVKTLWNNITSGISSGYQTTTGRLSNLSQTAKSKMTISSEKRHKIAFYGSAAGLTLILAFVLGKNLKNAQSAEKVVPKTEQKSQNIAQNNTTDAQNKTLQLPISSWQQDSLTLKMPQQFIEQNYKQNVSQKQQDVKEEKEIVTITATVKETIKTKQTVAKPTISEETKVKTVSKETKVTNHKQATVVKEQANITKITNKDSTAISYHQAIINHHDHVLDMQIGESNKQEMYKHIEQQLADSIYTLPENMSKEDFAYAMVMYQAYGLSSNIEHAYESKTKLDKVQNQLVIQDIINAGDTGLGVKKMAEKKYDGQLNHNSRYSKSSKKAQHQHNQNLQQWRMAKKMARAS